MPMRFGGSKCGTVPNFVQIGQGVTEISPFSIFRMAAVRHLGFLNVGNFNCPYPRMAKMCYHDKFCANRSMRCGDMAVFDFSRWRQSAILYF